MASKGIKMCQSCRALIPANAVRCEMCGAEGHYAARALDDEATFGLFAAWPVTVLLLTLNVAVYGLTLLYQMRLLEQVDQPLGFSLTPLGWVNDSFGTSQPGFWHSGEMWRLVASCFLHGGPLHLLMNSLAIMQAGRMAEEVFGRAQYICLYLLSGVSGNLLAAEWGTRVVGASGALFGLIAALAVYGYRRRDAFGRDLRQNMIYWLLYGLAISFFPGISWQAHVGGLLVGGVLALVLQDIQELRRNLLRVRLAQGLATVAWLVIAGTGILMARNVVRQNQALLIHMSAERVYTVWLNQLRLTRLLAGVALKQAGGDQNHQQLPPLPELTTGIDKTYKELCSDAGALGRLAATDEPSAQLYQRMSANLRARCDRPLPPPKAEDPASFTGYQQQREQGRELEGLMKDYEQWLEQKAASLHIPVRELKPRLVNQAGEEVEMNETGDSQ
jgi:membrane associated rhomboid family serine protease